MAVLWVPPALLPPPVTQPLIPTISQEQALEERDKANAVVGRLQDRLEALTDNLTESQGAAKKAARRVAYFRDEADRLQQAMQTMAAQQEVCVAVTSSSASVSN